MTAEHTHTTLRVAACQLNATVGDISGNAELIADALHRAQAAGARLAVTPELSVCGYPPEDLLAKAHFTAACLEAVREIATACPEIIALVGFPERDGALYNSLAVLHGGEIAGTYRKTLLPNYGVFDERRFFEPGEGAGLIEVNGALIGLTVCEDIWFAGPPASSEALAGAGLIVNASASPYHREKGAAREQMVGNRAGETEAAFLLCNAVGAQDELVFDGHSVAVDHDGRTIARARQFEPDLLVCDFDLLLAGPAVAQPPRGPGDVRLIGRFETTAAPPERQQPRIEPLLEPLAEIYAALGLGLRDYVVKNGFEHVVLGVSGGIDSAIVAAIACDALGPAAVHPVTMPSPFSSDETLADARGLAAGLGCILHEVPIEAIMGAYGQALDPVLGTGWETGLSFENVQARIRGNIVMALSNHNGWLPLSTGNKSEMAVGYATLYGDMAGGFALIKDVPKTLVYELARHRNEAGPEPVIPPSTIDRAPSAELRPGQLDTDSLPEYEVLDAILERYVEHDQSPDQIAAELGDGETVARVIRLVDRSEYKRRQAPPGVKITPRAFGRDRRLPITNRFGS